MASKLRTGLWVVRACLVASAILLGAGLAGPCMEIHPAFGALDGWVRLLKPALAQPTRYSVVGGIATLLENGSVLVGVTLLVFSVFFPTAKLALMASATASVANGLPPGPLIQIAHHAGKFSMLDVLVVGLLVLAIKGLPGGSKVTLGWGVGAFAASVVLSLLASVGLSMLERKAAAPVRSIAAQPATDRVL